MRRLAVCNPLAQKVTDSYSGTIGLTDSYRLRAAVGARLFWRSDSNSGYALPKLGINMLLDELHDKKEVIEALGRQYGARNIRVFGSVARREDLPDSDVDFLVEFSQGYDLFTQRLPFTDRLAELLHRKVDVVPEHELSPHLRTYVMQEAVTL